MVIVLQKIKQVTVWSFSTASAVISVTKTLLGFASRFTINHTFPHLLYIRSHSDITLYSQFQNSDMRCSSLISKIMTLYNLDCNVMLTILKHGGKDGLWSLQGTESKSRFITLGFFHFIRGGERKRRSLMTGK